MVDLTSDDDEMADNNTLVTDIDFGETIVVSRLNSLLNDDGSELVNQAQRFPSQSVFPEALESNPIRPQRLKAIRCRPKHMMRQWFYLVMKFLITKRL